MSAEAVTLHVADDGSLTIPAELLQTLKVSPQQTIKVEARENTLVISPAYQERLDRIGQLLRDTLTDVQWNEVEAEREDRW